MGYHVYRGKGKVPLTDKKEDSFLKRVTEEPVKDSTFVDTSVDLSDGIIRSYTVRAVNKLGQESGNAPLTYSIPDPVGGPWFNKQKNRIHWLAPANDHIKGYHVYRGIFSRGNDRARPENRLTEKPISGTSFKVDPELCANYSVAAVNKLGQIGFGSDDVFVVGPKVPWRKKNWCPFKQFHANSRLTPARPDPLWLEHQK